MMSSRKGFSLIELLIVVAISAIFSSLAILYSKQSQNQTALSVEAAKISQFILQAKQLSIATYTGGSGTACGYGVAFNFAAQTYRLYAYNPTGVSNCPSASAISGISAGDMQQYSQETWTTSITRGVVMLSSAPANNVLADVLFYPPAPTTLMSRNGSAFMSSSSVQTSKVYLKTANGAATLGVSVNPAGQVEIQ